MRILAIDCGGRSAYGYDGSEIKTFPREEMNKSHTLFNLQEGDRIVVEDAHAGTPKTEKSLAQVYTADELAAWYTELAEAGIRLCLFPESRTPYLKREGDQKSDENDVRILHDFAVNNLDYGYKKPRMIQGYSQRQKDGHEIVKRLNIVLNKARSVEYDDSVPCANFVRDNLDEIYNGMSDVNRRILFKHSEKTGKRSNGAAAMKTVVTRLAALAAISEAADGFPSWKFVKQHVLKMTPFHRNGGVLRSNIFWWGQRLYIRSKMGKLPADWRHDPELLETFKGHRKAYQDAIREAYRVLADVADGINQQN